MCYNYNDICEAARSPGREEGAPKKRNCNFTILVINCKQYPKRNQYSESNIQSLVRFGLKKEKF
jgi:hypothetical protein